MKKRISAFLILLIPIVGFGQLLDYGAITWQPPLCPFTLEFSEGNISVKASTSINTPIGEIGVTGKKRLFRDKNDNINEVVVDREEPKVIEIEVPKIIEREVIKRIPYIQVVEKEVVKEVIIKDRTYIFEIKNYFGSESQIFKIKGLDVLFFEVHGKVKIEAREGHITIDALEGTIEKITFNGGNLQEENMEDRIFKLCKKYNIENDLETEIKFDGEDPSFVTGNGFIFFDEKLLPNYVIHINRKLRADCQVESDCETIAYIPNFIVTTGGIGIRLNSVYRQGYDKHYHKSIGTFISWEDLFSYRFEKDKTDAIKVTRYSEEGLIGYFKHQSASFNNWEVIQIIEDLKKMVQGGIK